MVARASRRDFLRAGFTRSDLVRPYGASPPDRFGGLCNGCGDCVSACPESILIQGPDGKAQVDFSRGACTFCEECITACETGALSAQGRANWNWLAQTGTSCLALNGVTCRTCEDFCDERAIRFRLETGGRSRPVIDEAACNGCGACAGACPAGAIAFTRKTKEQREVA